jgi:uncharacterized iron-regulated membrane protein
MFFPSPASAGVARAPVLRRAWPGYAAIWRWHFYAGLFCIPFVLLLALTGSVYLFRPQVEAWLDRPYTNLAVTGPVTTPAAAARAAVRAVPGSVLHRFQLPERRGDAVQVIVGTGDAETRVYLHPQSLAVLKRAEEDSRPMRIVSRLHGTLLIGTTGSYIVELAASWAIVMILTGLFLWWPRGAGAAGVLYPRLRAGGRRFWRDLHGVTGFWVSGLALFLLISGLPWASAWGSYLQVARMVLEGAPVRQDWSRGGGSADAGTRAMAADHAEHDGMTMAHAPARDDAALDRVVASVRTLALAPPVLVAPPTAPGQPWTAKSDAANRPLRTDLTLDGTGAVLTRRDFAERRLVDRIVGYGIAAHEGQLFGWANQLLGLLTALGLMLLSVSSVVLWWRRKPGHALGAPPRRPSRPVAAGFVLLLVLIGVLLPMMGASMLLVLTLERLVLGRLPRARRWLGLERVSRSAR